MKKVDSLMLGKMVLRRSLADKLQLATGLDFSRPNSIRATLTERCNFKCSYCKHGRQEHFPEEMSLEEWQNALGSLKNFIGPYVIQFVGGEPFIWKGFLNLVEFCHDNGIRWGVITNGSGLNQKSIPRLVGANPLNIDISLDSLSPEINDNVRGKDNAVEHIIKNLDILLRERKHASSEFVIRIKATVTRHSFPYLVEMVEWAEKLGGVTVDFSPVRMWEQNIMGRQKLYPQSNEEFNLFGNIVQTLVKLKKSGSPIETSEEKLKSIVPHFRNETVFHGVSQCHSVLRNYHIDSSGYVSNCWSFGKIGNVKASSAKEIWNGSIRKNNVAPSTSCDKISTHGCATSCTTHRTLKQEIQRGIMMVKKL